ncbi:unnamed protein product [Brassica oleracea]
MASMYTLLANLRGGRCSNVMKTSSTILLKLSISVTCNYGAKTAEVKNAGLGAAEHALGTA